MAKIVLSGCSVDLGEKIILANDVTFPWEYNPHNVRLWLVHNEYGWVGAVWATCESDALDELVDAGLGDGILIDEAEADAECARLGNAGEPACLDNVGIEAVDLSRQSVKLLCAFAEARGNGHDTIDDCYRWSKEDVIA